MTTTEAKGTALITGASSGIGAVHADPGDTASGFLNRLRHDMAGFLKAAGLAAIFATGFATVTAQVEAAQLNTTVREGEGVTTELSANASALTYWVNKADGWHVVTTVDTLIRQGADGDKHAVVRFSSVLAPGQSQTISVPFAISERPQALRIRRSGDQLEIERFPGS